MKSRMALLSGIIILWLVACQPEAQPMMTTIAVERVTSTAIPTVTPLPLVTSTATAVSHPTTPATFTPTPTATIAQPTATPTTVAATLTPLPTLEGEALMQAVAELLANPMDCDVPCWWGAIPGITLENDIRHFISPYNFDIYEYEYEDNGKSYNAMALGIDRDEERNDFNIRMGFIFNNSILFQVSGYSPSISEVLAKYGQPDEVWLETMPKAYQGVLPVRLNMVYLKLGMAVGYRADGDSDNGVVTGCFADKETGRLRLIIPNTATSYYDFPIIFETDRHYRLLEEATSMTMAEFMQAFSDPTNPQCIETPAELWE